MKPKKELIKLLIKQAARKEKYKMKASTRDFLSGSAGAAAGTAAFFPLDTIITSMQSGTWTGRGKQERTGLRAQLRRQTLFGKTKRLYRGAHWKLLKNAPAMGLTLATYGAVQKYLNRHMNIVKDK